MLNRLCSKSWLGKGVLTLLLMTVMGFFTVVCAQTPEPSGKELGKDGGTFGTPPVATPGQAVTTEVKPGNIKFDKTSKTTLACGHEYQVSVRLTQAAECEGWHDGTLLKRAAQEASDTLYDYDCEDVDCRRHTWFTYFYTGCQGNSAVAQVNASVICAGENEDGLKSGVYQPDQKTVEEELKKQKSYTKGTDSTVGDNGQGTTQVYPDPVKCGSSMLVSYTTTFSTPIANLLKTGDKTMNPVKDFGPFYRLAVRQAETYFDDLVACDDWEHCHRAPFSVTYATWSASADTVTVTVYFTVTCTPK
jgi:hypothetical protein